MSFRLVVEQGLFWGFDAPFWLATLAFLGPIALLAMAWLLRRGGRASVIVVLESAVWMLGGIFTNLLMVRWLDANNAEHLAYVMMSLGGAVLLVLASNQLYRLKSKSRLRWRWREPWLPIGQCFLKCGPRAGRFLRLGAAYFLPAVLLAGIAWKQRHLPRWLRAGMWALAALWVSFEIRHFWLGDFMATNRC